MNKNNFQSKSEKALLGIYLLNKEIKKPITVEDLAVKLWTLYDTEFCMKGYSQYPNVDIQKYLTKLFRSNLIKGGVFGYKITDKGIKLVENLLSNKNVQNDAFSKLDVSMSRELKMEISRILNSKVYKYYIKNLNTDFLELDFFDFLGTSSRSLSDKRNSQFLSKINLIKIDLVEYCKKNQNEDPNLKKILDLWIILNNKFGEIIK